MSMLILSLKIAYYLEIRSQKYVVLLPTITSKWWFFMLFVDSLEALQNAAVMDEVLCTMF
jgi:hypothetical protein